MITPTQQTPCTGDRARCAASTAPNTRGETRESTAACGRRPGPPRSCRCSRSGDRHCATGSRGTNRPRVRPAAPPQPPLGCVAFCTGSCTRDRAGMRLCPPLSRERANMVRKRSQLFSNESSNASIAAQDAWLRHTPRSVLGRAGGVDPNCCCLCGRKQHSSPALGSEAAKFSDARVSLFPLCGRS